jgi:NitT/TauT family transport system substrate-binding protein
LASRAQAEVSEVRFARQLGFGYLQLYVMQDQKLVEKRAAEAGLKLTATYIPLGNPAAINDALLSNTADYAAAGVPSFVIAWDKTRGNFQVKAVAALNGQPVFLNTNKPELKSLKDITEKDRIALPSVKVSFQAMVLEMAAEQVFGPGQHERLDHLTVSIAHPDGTAALLGGRSEITAHFTSAPFQYQQLQDPKIHKVMSSYDITGPATFSAIWSTAKFRTANPQVYKVVLDSLEEATQFINTRPAEAAQIFARIERSTLTQEFLVAMLTDKDIFFSTTPQSVQRITEFMARTGSIKAAPAVWQDLFFPEVHAKPGS